MNAPHTPSGALSVLDLPSMQMASPSCPRGPYRFLQREYLIVIADLTLPYGRVIHDYLAT